jgi:5-methylcytosine-specific restriction endonuclease McrA
MAKRGLPAIANWAKIRKKVLDRDNFVCRMKGCSAIDNLNVHHIDYERANNEDDNLVTLCGVCHRAVHKEGYKPCLYEDWPVPWDDAPQEFYFD